MELRMLRLSLICLLVVAIVYGAEEPTYPSHKEEQLTISKLEEADHGPLMKALLAPGETGSTEGPELQRDKRHKKWYGQRATWKHKGGGGCYGGCGGGGGGYYVPIKVIVVKQPKWGGGGGGGGCGYGGCGGGRPVYNQHPSGGGGYCNTCGGGGGGGGSFSYAQASASSGSWGGKK